MVYRSYDHSKSLPYRKCTMVRFTNQKGVPSIRFTLPMLYYSEGFQKVYRSTPSLRCPKHPPEQFNSAKCVSNPITANHKKDNQQKCFPFAATESVEQISDQSGNVCLDCQTGLYQIDGRQSVGKQRKAIRRDHPSGQAFCALSDFEHLQALDKRIWPML